MKPPDDAIEADILETSTEHHAPGLRHMIADLLIERLLIRLGFSKTATVYSKIRTKTRYVD